MRIVSERRARQTGALVCVIDNRDGSFDEGEAEIGYTWATLCDDHGNYVMHETRALATAHAADPAGWCEDCADNLERLRLNRGNR
jgi:hypothetical protein